MSSSPSSSSNNWEKEVYIGLDVGTQGTKALLYHPHSNSILCRASVSYDLSPNTNNISGRAEQDPKTWVDAVYATLTQIKEFLQEQKKDHTAKYQVSGIGVSGQQHGMVALDENLNVIRDAKLWCDVEASEQATSFSTKATEIMAHDDDVKWNIPAGFTAPKVLWMKEKEPENWEKVRWVVLPHDYINLILKTEGREATNGSSNEKKHEPDAKKLKLEEPTTDAGDASGSGILNPITREYVSELAQCIDEKYANGLPKILPPNAVSGYLSSYWKDVILGIKKDDDDNESNNHHHHPIPISVGSGDNMCSALGCGCVTPGMAVMSLGTSGTIFGVSDEPVKTGTPVAPFCDATGRHLPLACVMSCTGVLQSVLDQWCSPNIEAEEEEKMTHAKATELAMCIPAGCHGITFLPYLGGERTPNWPHATGALLGLAPNNMNHVSSSPGVMYRAAMEGITYLMADALEQMRNACGGNNGGGFTPTCLLVVGGGSKNMLWRQMLSDVLGLKLRFPLESETAALGAAFQAGAAARCVLVDEFVLGQEIEMEDVVVKPTADEDTLRLYRDGLARYRDFSRKLFAPH